MIAEPLVEVRCAVCGSEAHTEVCTAREVQAQLDYLRRFHQRRLRPGAPAEALEERAAFTQDDPTAIVACERCGLVFRNPRPRAEVIARRYAGDRYGRRRLEELFASQVELYRPKARSLARWLPRKARVVEVGSFVGGFLAAGQEQGWEMLGVDPGAEVDAFCAERGLPVFRGTLAEAPLEDGSVDAVAIWNTLDQLPDPAPTMAVAPRLLRPNGVLALRAPNGACFRWAVALMRRLPHPTVGWLRAALAWNNLLAFPYLIGYSRPTLEALLARHGMERLTVRPDVLGRLADEQTKSWAAWEERALKLLCRLAMWAEGVQPGSRLFAAPWLEACCRID